MVKPILLVLAGLVFTACGYGAHFEDCTIQCVESGCPAGMTCGSEGLCRAPGVTSACAAEPVPDGAAPACSPTGSSADLALMKPTTADEMAQPSSNANDGDDATRWSSNDGTPGHWWQVDLGANYLLTTITTLWEYDGVDYQYAVTVSSDGTGFVTVIDEAADTRTVRSRTDSFPSANCARFIKITKTDTTGYWAILYSVKVMGQ